MTTIFIVEDQSANMKLIKGVVTRDGYATLEAESADIAIPLIREQQPDLVLMDIHLPGTDGLTATRLLKQDKLTSHIPIIAVTAKAMEGDREMILAAGCDDYASKPIRYKELLKLIKDVLRSSLNEK
jgi:two-component system, cell cycle response regulator DivK